MNKIISLIIGISILAACGAGVLADEAPAEQTTETTVSATTEPEAQTEATIQPAEPAATAEPVQEATPTPAPTAAPTAMPTPAQKINPFFCAMQNGSTFAYVDDGENIKYVPMVASTNVSQIPDVVEGRTYLPFRYIFDELFGFKDKAQNQNEPLAAELNNNEYTYGFSGADKVFTIKYKYNNNEVTLSNGEIKSVTDPRDGNTQDMIVLNVKDGASYLPLVYFAAEGLCSIDYDGETKNIYIADSKEAIKKYSAVINNRKYTNNFITQADTVQNNDSIISISKETGGWYRGASGNFNLTVFQDVDNKLQYMDLSNGISRELVIKDESGNRIDLLADRAVIYGNRIFGLKVSEDRRRAGQIFEATLDVDSITYIQNTYNIFARNYKTKINNDVIMYNLQEEINDNKEKVPVIYYVDVDQNYKLRRLDVNSGTVTDVTVNGAPVTNADYFAIGGGYIVYNDFAERKIKAVNIDGSGNLQTLVDLGDVDIQFIIFDGKESFYYIQTSVEPNEIKEIKLNQNSFSQPDTIFSADRIRNISAYDGSVYANVNNNFVQCR